MSGLYLPEYIAKPTWIETDISLKRNGSVLRNVLRVPLDLRDINTVNEFSGNKDTFTKILKEKTAAQVGVSSYKDPRTGIEVPFKNAAEHFGKAGEIACGKVFKRPIDIAANTTGDKGVDFYLDDSGESKKDVSIDVKTKRDCIYRKLISEKYNREKPEHGTKPLIANLYIAAGVSYFSPLENILIVDIIGVVSKEYYLDKFVEEDGHGHAKHLINYMLPWEKTEDIYTLYEIIKAINESREII